jgi:hypothetical protein
MRFAVQHVQSACTDTGIHVTVGRIVRKVLSAAITGGLVGAAPAVWAVQIAADNFDTYTVGAAAGNAGPGWGGAWVTTGASSEVAATTVADAPMSGNALLVTTNNANGTTRTLATAQTGGFWVDFLIQFESGTINNNDGAWLWLDGSTSVANASRDNVPNIGINANCGFGSCTTFDLFVRMGSDVRHVQNINVGETYRVVGFLEKTGVSTTYNRFQMWVNPTNTELATVSGSDLDASLGSSPLTDVGRIGFRGFGLDTSDTVLVDALSVHSGRVVPLPGSLALAALGLLAMAGLSRRNALRRLAQ